jgi:prolyl-tRNA synthetase
LTNFTGKVRINDMKQSQLFYKTTKENPKDEEAKNAQLLVRAGYIDKVMAGVYNYLPLGHKILVKIQNIIREEMNKIGAQEILMPVLHPKENWEKTGRWDVMDVLFKIKGAGNKEMALGPTHEEIVTPLAQKYILSYKDLPRAVYQIQTKFRNEPRSKSGLLRGREFNMKDLYSFHKDEKDLDEFYAQAEKAYENIWKRMGLGDITYKTYASGGDFSKYSHEYQTVHESGEDTIYICEKCKVAVNKEIIDEQNVCPVCENKDLQEKSAIEVGNIFKLKTKFSDAFEFKFVDEDNQEKQVFMGCYGIGPSRVMGTLVEVFNDERGIVWPENLAPYRVHLVNLKKDKIEADELYKELKEKNIDVLYDDRDESAGIKLADADLIGIPHRVIVSQKTDGKVEYKKRDSADVEIIEKENLFEKIK